MYKILKTNRRGKLEQQGEYWKGKRIKRRKGKMRESDRI